MEQFLENLYRNIYFLYCLLVVIFAYSIPIFGVFISEIWYKWIYIFGSHIIGLVIFLFVYNKYLKMGE